jgi:tetratricopeptide (TPR) repeat protein
MPRLPIGNFSYNFILLQPIKSVNRQQFFKVLQPPYSIGPDTLTELDALSREYPYSQVVHTLLAKGTHDAKTKDAPARLAKAAMYIADRSVLRDIIVSDTDGYVAPTTRPVEATPPTIVSTPNKKPLPSYNDLQPIGHEDAEVLRREVLQNLAQLVKLKHQYELEEAIEAKEAKEASKAKVSRKPKLSAKSSVGTASKKEKALVKTTQVGVKPVTDSKKVSPKKEVKTKQSDDKKAAPTKKKAVSSRVNAKAKKEETPENPVEEVVTEAAEILEAPTPTLPKKRRSKHEMPVPESPEDVLIEQLANKQLKVPKSISQKEQLHIIEQFIKTQPSLKVNKPGTADDKEQRDLSQNSTEFGEDLISENLAQILAKQGKKEKAIDIYKKLIWKFPQKKAYFAALIEDLKK